MHKLLNHPIIRGYIDANNFGKLLGMNFDIVGDNEVVYTMEVKKEHLATPIAAHGGSISALMDAIMGVSALSSVILEGKVVSTLEMKLSFVAPALLGDVLIGKSSIVKSGSRLIFVEGEIKDQNNKIIAVASGTFNSYPSEKAGFKKYSARI